jgi:5-methylcytosine-specific restriction endonuclease McrA
MATVDELEARRALLLKQLGRCGPLIEGSMAVVHRKCGTPACQCHVDESRRHRQAMLCRKVEGRSYSTHIPKDLEETVREWNEEFKRAKGLLKEISDLSEQIVRGHVASHRRQVQGAGAEETARA